MRAGRVIAEVVKRQQLESNPLRTLFIQNTNIDVVLNTLSKLQAVQRRVPVGFFFLNFIVAA